MNNIAYLNNVVVLNEKNPIGYTYNLVTCFAALIKRENSELLIHVFADLMDFDKKHFIDALNMCDDDIVKVEIYKGPQTTDFVIDKVLEELYLRDVECEINDSYLNTFGTEGSIGYDHNEKCYYSVNDYIEPQKMPNLKKELK